MNTNHQRRRRGTVALAAVAAGALAALGAALPASADSPILPSGTTGNLHIIKHIEPDTPGAPADGTTASAPSTGVLPGATFEIWKVKESGTAIDLGTNAGWQKAAALAVDLGTDLDSTTDYATAAAAITAANANYTVEAEGSGVSDTTDVNGEALFSSLSLGLYLVVETDLPPLADGGIAPFLVTVPITDPSSADHWLTDVYVYPKNHIITSDKTVDDATVTVDSGPVDGGVGDGSDNSGTPITYTVTVPIPDHVSSFVFTDDLPAQLGPITASDISVTVDGDPLPADTPTTGAGYAWTGGNNIVLTFGATGIAAANAADAGDEIVVTITSTVETAGEFQNTADGLFNDGQADETDLPSNGVTSKWGKVTLHKWWNDGDPSVTTYSDTDAAPITGAEFQLYFSSADAQAGTNPYEEGGTPVTFTTDGTGAFDVLLRYNEYEDGAAAVTPATYYFVETKAGTDGTNTFELLTAPIALTVGDGTEVNSAGKDLDVQNVPTLAGFTLPLTGGFGTAIFSIIGGGLIALTVILLVVFGIRRRKEREQH